MHMGHPKALNFARSLSIRRLCPRVLPNPIPVFIGYNSKLEGVDQRNLIVERADNIIFSGDTIDISKSYGWKNVQERFLLTLEVLNVSIFYD